MNKILNYFLIGISAAALIAAAIPAVIRLQFSYVTTWKYCAKFDAFSEEFQTVADYVLLESSGKSGYYDVSRTENGDRTLYDPKTKCYLDLPAGVNAALQKICSKKAFPNKDSSLQLIYFSENRVSFKKECGCYALVYSPEEKPTYWHSPTDGHSILVKTIGNGWYHIVISHNS